MVILQRHQCTPMDEQEKQTWVKPYTLQGKYGPCIFIQLGKTHFQDISRGPLAMNKCSFRCPGVFACCAPDGGIFEPSEPRYGVFTPMPPRSRKAIISQNTLPAQQPASPASRPHPHWQVSLEHTSLRACGGINGGFQFERISIDYGCLKLWIFEGQLSQCTDICL